MVKAATSQKRAHKSPQFRKELLILTVLLFVLGGIYVLYSRAAIGRYAYNASTNTPSGRLFSDDSPLNQAIPGDVRYLPDGQTRLKAAGLPAASSLLEWSVPVFHADANTPKAVVWCYVYTCDEISKTPVPVPSGVFKQRGGDGHVTIIDTSTRKIYSYWIWKDCTLTWNWIGAQWCPGSAGVASIDGNGVGGGTNVAGLAGGIVRTYEIEQGVIDHALTFSTSTTCKGEPYYPALHSDGTTADQTTCIPIGSRIQLDPSINVDAIPGITQLEKIVARALQKYGAYADDTGGIFGIGVEFDRTGRNVYQKAGASTADYFPYKSIPWDKVKVIEPQWKKDGTKAYAWGASPVATPTTSVTPTTTTSPVVSGTPSPVPTTTILPTPTPTTSPNPIVSPAPNSLDQAPPTQPTNLRPSLVFDWTRGRYNLQLTWLKSSDNVGIKDYLVTRNSTVVGPVTTTSFVDTAVEAGTTYNYELRARDTAGNVSTPTKLSVQGQCFLIWCWLL